MVLEKASLGESDIRPITIADVLTPENEGLQIISREVATSAEAVLYSIEQLEEKHLARIVVELLKKRIDSFEDGKRNVWKLSGKFLDGTQMRLEYSRNKESEGVRGGTLYILIQFPDEGTPVAYSDFGILGNAHASNFAKKIPRRSYKDVLLYLLNDIDPFEECEVF